MNRRHLYCEFTISEAREAMAIYVATYAAITEHETHPADKADLQNYVDAGVRLAQRFCEAATSEAGLDMSPGEMAILERAFRMQASHHQMMIRADMTSADKAALRAKAATADAEITKLRKARGLPW